MKTLPFFFEDPRNNFRTTLSKRYSLSYDHVQTWIEYLRSGKYKQASNQLVAFDEDVLTDEILQEVFLTPTKLMFYLPICDGFCCLGVWGATNNIPIVKDIEHEHSYGQEFFSIRDAINSGLLIDHFPDYKEKDEPPLQESFVPSVVYGDCWRTVAELNDDLRTKQFETIANCLEDLEIIAQFERLDALTAEEIIEELQRKKDELDN